jgi:hypothetical protein
MLWRRRKAENEEKELHRYVPNPSACVIVGIKGCKLIIGFLI